MLTEQEAKKKWCPFARPMSANGQTIINRNVTGEISAKSMCIGSACMAWRDSAENVIGIGYCGLAGKP